MFGNRRGKSMLVAVAIAAVSASGQCAVRRKSAATRRRTAGRGPAGRATGPRRPRRPAARAQGASGLGRHTQRPGATCLHIARAGDRRTPWLRVGPVGHVHSHRLAHHLQSGAENRWHARERRAEPEQRRRHLLSRTSRRADHRSAEGGAAGVRSRRQRLRRGAHGAHGVRIVAGVRRDARRRRTADISTRGQAG